MTEDCGSSCMRINFNHEYFLWETQHQRYSLCILSSCLWSWCVKDKMHKDNKTKEYYSLARPCILFHGENRYQMHSYKTITYSPS